MFLSFLGELGPGRVQKSRVRRMRQDWPDIARRMVKIRSGRVFVVIYY